MTEKELLSASCLIDISEYGDEIRQAAAELSDIEFHGYANCSRGYKDRGGGPYERFKDGMCGEYALQVFLGLRPEPMRPLRGGDRGTDLILGNTRFQVKTSNFWPDPHLKQDAATDYEWADRYVLAALPPLDSLERRIGLVRLCGWTTSEELRNAPTRSYGHGNIVHHLRVSDLRPMYSCAMGI